MAKKRIYLDLCCLNRPFDEQTQDRVRLETEAVLSILSRCQRGKWELVGSDALEVEMTKSSDLEKLAKVQALYSLADQRLTVTEDVEKRSLMLQGIGLKTFDSLHLALAEAYRCDVLLTTDDNFIMVAGRTESDVAVANPITWLMEVQHGN